jgi:hypothetical protein
LSGEFRSSENLLPMTVSSKYPQKVATETNYSTTEERPTNFARIAWHGDRIVQSRSPRLYREHLLIREVSRGALHESLILT